jgi:hypothetical protein
MDIYLIISIFLIIIIILISIYFIVKILRILYTKNNIKQAQDKIKKDCRLTRWGCCNDRLTPKLDQDGSNCRGF